MSESPSTVETSAARTFPVLPLKNTLLFPYQVMPLAVARSRSMAAVDATLPSGVATGLAWTEAGGDVLYVEAALLPGAPEVTLTGQLGDVMKESARAAISYIRAHSRELGIKPSRFRRNGVHIHVPAGAIPKDGPSAGVTMVTAIASLFLRKTVRPDTAMTGEITLTGLVLPVGGIREKVLAAHRAGIRRVILPKDNERDLGKLSPEIQHEMEFVLAGQIEDALTAAIPGFVVFGPQPEQPTVTHC